MALVAITVPGGPELLVILLIFVLLFGARKLPELGSSIGKSIKNFKSGMAEAEADDTDGGAEARSGQADGASPAQQDRQ